jgi:hypothetical protein
MKNIFHGLTFLTEETEEKSGTIATFKAHEEGLFLVTSVLFDGVKTRHSLIIRPHDVKLLSDYLKRSLEG